MKRTVNCCIRSLISNGQNRYDERLGKRSNTVRRNVGRRFDKGEITGRTINIENASNNVQEVHKAMFVSVGRRNIEQHARSTGHGFVKIEPKRSTRPFGTVRTRKSAVRGFPLCTKR